LIDFVGLFGGHVDVQAQAYDDGCVFRVWQVDVLGEDAGDFLLVDEDVVGPFELGVQVEFFEGIGDSYRGDEGEAMEVVSLGGGADEEGAGEVLSGGGYPGSAYSALALGLGMGGDDGSIGQEGVLQGQSAQFAVG